MSALGERLLQIRGERSRAEISVDASEYTGEACSEDWLARFEGGARESFAPWEFLALAEGLCSVTGPNRAARVEELRKELCALAGM